MSQHEHPHHDEHDHDHPHEHVHEHSHAHPHTHDNDHAHEHVHHHEHSHTHDHHDHEHHGHDHEHTDHHHYHQHAEHENEKAPQSPSERDKLGKMVAHWIQHNEEHARSYREWALRALEMGLADVKRLLEEVAEETHRQNAGLKKVLAVLGGKMPSD